jgi:zinc protease
MRIIFIFGLLMLASPAQALAQAHETASPSIALPKLAYSARTLENGARLYTIRDSAASTVTVATWYDVGQRDDPRGRGGFAHLFEHLMFKATRNLPDGVLPFVTGMGGQSNATTLFDYTSYYVTAPADRLESLLWLEGERLRNLVVDEASFESERKVVGEELRQRILAQPYGRILYTLLPAFTFGSHPYRRPIGGTIEDLDKATLADVRAFHEAYYRPDNAIFVISGNFDPALAKGWADRYLGSAARPPQAIPRDRAADTAPLTARTVDAYAPNVPLPALIFSWRAPNATDPDRAALTVIEALLTRGSAARLRRRLVDELQLASNISAFNLPARDGHAFALVVTLAKGGALAETEAALAAEIARLRDQPVSAEELRSVKNGILGAALFNRETVAGRAFELGEGVALTGDPSDADRQLHAVRALGPGRLQAVARRWLPDARRVTIRYQDESRRPQGYHGDAAPDISTMGTIVPAATRPPVRIAAAGEAERPPAPGPKVRRVLPAIAERRLANGLLVVTARSTDIPLATLKLVIPGGDAADPPGKAGLADLVAALALRGAGERDAAGIARAVASLGGTISATAEPDATVLTLSLPAAHARAGGEILADLVLRPSFAAAELDRVRKLQADTLAVAGRQPMQAALRLLPAAMFRGTDYGGLASPATLEAIDHGDVINAYRRWSPAGSTLIVSGALTDAQAGRLAESLFGRWGGAEPPQAPAAIAPILPGEPRVLVVDIPGAGQAAVLAAIAIPGRDSADWPAVRIANARLGSGFQGFLSQEIRVKRGLSYGAGSLIEPRRRAALLFAATQTRNETADQVVGLVIEQIGRIAGEPMAAGAIAERATFLTNSLATQTERSSGLADYLAGLVTAGAPLATARRELAGEAPAAAAIDAAAKRYFKPEAATIVVAGDAGKWLSALRARYPQLVVVKADGTPAS